MPSPRETELEILLDKSNARQEWYGKDAAYHQRKRQEAEDKVARLEAVIASGLNAFRLTREYLGEEVLPALPGWSWYDWSLRAEAALKDESDLTDDEVVKMWDEATPVDVTEEPPGHICCPLHGPEH